MEEASIIIKAICILAGLYSAYALIVGAKKRDAESGHRITRALIILGIALAVLGFSSPDVWR